jgi:hypothetical protein
LLFSLLLAPAGIAAMLAIHLKNRGMSADSLRCWAYESPACMDKGLAEGCAGAWLAGWLQRALLQCGCLLLSMLR